MSAERADRYGVVPMEIAKSLSGLQLLTGIMKGELPEPPIQQALDFRLVQVERGYTAFAGVPKFNYYNPLGSSMADMPPLCSIPAWLARCTRHLSRDTPM